MRKQLTSFSLCIFICLAMIPVSAQATEIAEVNAPGVPTEGDVWDGSITQPTKLVQKDGVYYYEITKCSELAYVAQIGGDWLLKNYILGNNLILNETAIRYDEDGICCNASEMNRWVPIGDSAAPFEGIFDGNDYTIVGLYVNIVSEKSISAGLFGRSIGIIKNLGVVDGCVSAKTTQTDGYNVIWAGGIVADNRGIINNCFNTGKVQSDAFTKDDNVGGICGFSNGTITNCCNAGNISGYHAAGIGGGTISNCFNIGDVFGQGYAGGICGYVGNEILNCYNMGTITGERYVGGIAAELGVGAVKNCYNIGDIKELDKSGSIVGYIADYSVNRISITDCYFLEELASGVGYGPDNTNKCTQGDMKFQDTFVNWDFTDIWSISAAKNGGYPYLQWQESSLSNIPVNKISLSDTALNLSVGDSAYLTVTVSPVNASDKSVTWKSSDSDIATVSAAGKVTAVSAGTAIITAVTVDGGYTASCAVTVTERLAEEYIINSITVRDNDDAVLSTIPNGDCLATVSITNLASKGNTLVFLAAYTSTGQYQGMMWVSVEDLPVGATIKVTLPVDNSDGKITNLKAFTIASFANLTPLGNAVSFLP